MRRHAGMLVGLLVFALAAAGGYGAAFAMARRAASVPGPVVLNRDPAVPGHWAVAFRDGLLVLVAAPELKYPHVGRAPTFRVWAVNLGRRPVRFGYEDFRVVSQGRVRPVDDGEPPLGSRVLQPLAVSHGAVTYYGPPVDRLLIEHGRQRVTVYLSGSYPAVSSVAGWLTRLWGRLPEPTGHRPESPSHR